MDDAQLLRCYVEDGSEPAFAELVGRHLNLVHAAAMRQVGGDFHRAGDVAQMVFIQLARKAASLTGHTALTGWLYTTTFYAAAQVMRTERRREEREKKAHIMNELTYSSKAAGDWDQLKSMLDSVMHELNDRDRETILWRFFDAQPMATIGARLGVSDNAVQKRVDRALDKMRASFTRRGVESSTAALALMLANQAVMAAPAGLAESVTAAAMASAVGAGSSGFALWQVLSTTKSILGASASLWIGGILGLSAIGAAIYEFRATPRAQTSLTAALHDPENQPERLLVAKAPGTGATPVGLDPFAAGRKFLARFPGARALLMAAGVVDAARKNEPFFRREHLTPGQIEQFETLLAANWTANLVITPTSMAAGVIDPPEDQIRQLFGDPVAQRYENYVQTQYAYQCTGLVAAALSAAGLPMASEQIDRLAQIIETNSSFRQNNRKVDKNTVSYSGFADSVDWDGVETQARAVLSPAQWEEAQGPFLSAQARGALFRGRRNHNLDKPEWARDMRAITLPAAVTGNPPWNDYVYAQLAAVDPKFAALVLQDLRANLAGFMAGSFGSFCRALNLTPDQTGKFEDLMAGSHTERDDIVVRAEDLKGDAAATAVAIRQLEGQLDAAQAALLGESRYQQLQQFNRAEPVSEIVNSVAFSVALSSSPLTGQQIDELSQILTHSSSSFQSGGSADPATINWDAALAQAHDVLSDAQFAALRGQYAQAQLSQMQAQFYEEEAAAK